MIDNIHRTLSSYQLQSRNEIDLISCIYEGWIFIILLRQNKHVLHQLIDKLFQVIRGLEIRRELRPLILKKRTACKVLAYPLPLKKTSILPSRKGMIIRVTIIISSCTLSKVFVHLSYLFDLHIIKSTLEGSDTLSFYAEEDAFITFRVSKNLNSISLMTQQRMLKYLD